MMGSHQVEGQQRCAFKSSLCLPRVKAVASRALMPEVSIPAQPATHTAHTAGQHQSCASGSYGHWHTAAGRHGDTRIGQIDLQCQDSMPCASHSCG